MTPDDRPPLLARAQEAEQFAIRDDMLWGMRRHDEVGASWCPIAKVRDLVAAVGDLQAGEGTNGAGHQEKERMELVIPSGNGPVMSMDAGGQANQLLAPIAGIRRRVVRQEASASDHIYDSIETLAADRRDLLAWFDTEQTLHAAWEKRAYEAEARAEVAEAQLQAQHTIWLCFDCDKWFVLARERCECGALVEQRQLLATLTQPGAAGQEEYVLPDPCPTCGARWSCAHDEPIRAKLRLVETEARTLADAADGFGGGVSSQAVRDIADDLAELTQPGAAEKEK